MPITMFNKAVCANVRRDIEEALEQVCSKYGIECRIEGGSYTEGSYTPKMEFIIAGAQTRKEERVESALALFAPDLVGKKYRHPNGMLMTIYGYDTRKRQYPILAVREDGTKFKTSDWAARNQVEAYEASKPKSRRVS